MEKIRLELGPLVLPMPTVLIGATVKNVPNFMPAAFIGIVNFNPVVVACGLSPTHHRASHQGGETDFAGVLGYRVQHERRELAAVDAFPAGNRR